MASFEKVYTDFDLILFLFIKSKPLYQYDIVRNHTIVSVMELSVQQDCSSLVVCPLNYNLAWNNFWYSFLVLMNIYFFNKTRLFFGFPSVKVRPLSFDFLRSCFQVPI